MRRWTSLRQVGSSLKKGTALTHSAEAVSPLSAFSSGCRLPGSVPFGIGRMWRKKVVSKRFGTPTGVIHRDQLQCVLTSQLGQISRWRTAPAHGSKLSSGGTALAPCMSRYAGRYSSGFA